MFVLSCVFYQETHELWGNCFTHWACEAWKWTWNSCLQPLAADSFAEDMLEEKARELVMLKLSFILWVISKHMWSTTKPSVQKKRHLLGLISWLKENKCAVRPRGPEGRTNLCLCTRCPFCLEPHSLPGSPYFPRKPQIRCRLLEEARLVLSNSYPLLCDLIASLRLMLLILMCSFEIALPSTAQHWPKRFPNKDTVCFTCLCLDPGPQWAYI